VRGAGALDLRGRYAFLVVATVRCSVETINEHVSNIAIGDGTNLGWILRKDRLVEYFVLVNLVSFFGLQACLLSFSQPVDGSSFLA